MIVDGVHTIAHGHVDDAIGDQALRFLRGRPHDRPFALLYQFKAPHGNWQPAPRFAKAFEDMEMPEPPTLYEDLAGRPRAVRQAALQLAGMGDFRDPVPASLPARERLLPNSQQSRQHYYRALLSVKRQLRPASASHQKQAQ